MSYPFFLNFVSLDGLSLDVRLRKGGKELDFVLAGRYSTAIYIRRRRRRVILLILMNRF
jgi:hypothetical protein